jgi:hypothetical protein
MGRWDRGSVFAGLSMNICELMPCDGNSVHRRQLRAGRSDVFNRQSKQKLRSVYRQELRAVHLKTPPPPDAIAFCIWVEKIPSSLGAARPIDQSGERLSVIFEPFLLLTTLRKQKARGFQRMIAGDKSLFFLYYPRDSVWAASRDEIPHASSRKSTRQSA